MIKITAWNDLQDNVAEILVRDCDDNPMMLEGNYDRLETVDSQGKTTVFKKCSMVGRNSDYVDPTYRMLVHPYIYRYESREDIYDNA